MIKNIKFAKQDDVSELFEKIMSCEMGKKDDIISAMNIRYSFDPMLILGCSRRMFYRSSGEDGCKAPSYMEELTTDFHKQKWANFFESCGKIQLMGTNHSTSDCNYNLVGVVDYILAFDEYIAIAKLNVVKDSVYEKIDNSKRPRKKDIIDAMANVWMMELSDGILIYENEQTNQYITFHVTLHKPIINAVSSKCRELMEYKLRGEQPPRPYETGTADECVICEFKNKCW